MPPKRKTMGNQESSRSTARETRVTERHKNKSSSVSGKKGGTSLKDKQTKGKKAKRKKATGNKAKERKQSESERPRMLTPYAQRNAVQTLPLHLSIVIVVH